MSIADYPDKLNDIYRCYQYIGRAIDDINKAVGVILPVGGDQEFGEIMRSLDSATNDLEYWIDKQISELRGKK